MIRRECNPLLLRAPFFPRPEELLMNTGSHRVWLSCFALLLASAPAGKADDPKKQPIPEVPVSQPLVRELTDQEQFTGRTEAARSVEIRARVAGFLDKATFKEGADVNKGELLFEVDPRPYQAELAKAQANLALSEARLKQAEADYARAKTLDSNKVISQGELDKVAAQVPEAKAAVTVAKANLDLASLNLSFTKVTAPISGRISRRNLDPGNLVKADETVLATIVTLDPIYVYFDVDERTALRLRKAQRDGQLKAKDGVGLPVDIGLADEEVFIRGGKVDWMDAQLNPKVGALRMRAIFTNADGVLFPGMFARVHLTTREPYKALLVPVSAVGFDKDQPFLVFVNAKNVIERRRVELGRQVDWRQENLIVVTAGLKEGDWVVLDGKNKLKLGTLVKPKKVPLTEEKPDKGPPSGPTRKKP